VTKETRTELTEPQAMDQGSGTISRRKLLASLGMAGAALATTGIVNGALTRAYADPVDNRTKVKDLMTNHYVVVTTIAELRAISSPDAEAVYFVKDEGEEGHFYYDAADTASPDDGKNVLVSSSGARFKRIYDAGRLGEMLADNGLYEYDRVKPVPPAGQLANEAEVIIPYKGTLYCLFKGSYSLLDQSYICVVRPDGEGSIKVVSRMDIGVGADARAMAIHNDDVFVFVGNKIKVYRIIDTGLQFKLEYTRKLKSDGFVQTCCIINGRLYAPNWGWGTIEKYDLVNGVPSNEASFNIGAVGNASIASNGSIHYLITWKPDNNITRLDIDGYGNVYNRGTFTIPGIYAPRYAHIHNGVMTVGGYGTIAGQTVALDISSGTPVKIGAYINMPTHVRVGDYLIGWAADQKPAYESTYRKLVRVRMSDGAVEVLSDRALLYPVLYKETVYGFLMGQEGSSGAHAGDSPLGQEIACYSTNALKKGIQIPTDAPDYTYTDTIRYTNIKNYEEDEVIARFQNFSPNSLGWLKVKLSYAIINNQNVPGQTIVQESVYQAFKNSTGAWQMTLPKVDLRQPQGGELAVTLDFKVSGPDAYVAVSGDLTNALINMSIQFDVTDKYMGSFHIV